MGNAPWASTHEGIVDASGNDYLSIYNGQPFASFSIGGVQKTLASGVTISTGIWHYVASTWDGSGIRIFIDGALAAFTPATGGSLSESTALTIGSLGGAYYFNGSLQEAAVYAQALTPASPHAPYRTATA